MKQGLADYSTFLRASFALLRFTKMRSVVTKSNRFASTKSNVTFRFGNWGQGATLAEFD